MNTDPLAAEADGNHNENIYFVITCLSWILCMQIVVIFDFVAPDRVYVE